MDAAVDVSVVLIHGYLDDGSVWAAVVESLNTVGVHTHAPTYSWTDGRSLRDFAAEVIADIETRGYDRMVLVGHSMGAPVAELVARELGSDRVIGLCLITPIPLGGIQLPGDVASVLRDCGEDAEVQRRLRSQLSVALPSATREALVAIGVQMPAARVAAVFDAWSGGDQVAAASPPPQISTVIVTTDDTFFGGDDVVMVIRQRFPDAAYLEIRGAGHWPQAENPEAVASLIGDFIVALPQTSSVSRAEDVSGQPWTAAFAEGSEQAFAAGFASDVHLEAAVLLKPFDGRDAVAAVMQEASNMYSRLEFLSQIESGRQRILTWQASTHSGLDVEGVTILEHDEAGLIMSAAIHHRPLGALVKFSHELGERLKGQVARGHFWHESPLL
jgi:pimeloyl-ACP methyl ester carboxylesterase